jgi:hypothetical protein
VLTVISRLLALACSLALVACSSSVVPSAAADPDPEVAVAELSATLTDALTAAKSYGMKHLGHYLELDGQALVDEGFTAPAGIAVAVQPDHTGFCLAAEHTALPADHAWRIASIDSRLQQPTPGNTCAPGTAPAQAVLEASVTTAGGGLVCLLPSKST